MAIGRRPILADSARRFMQAVVKQQWHEHFRYSGLAHLEGDLGRPFGAQLRRADFSPQTRAVLRQSVETLFAS